MSGALSCDVMQLRKLLMMELNSTQGPSLAANHQGILEVHILLYRTDSIVEGGLFFDGLSLKLVVGTVLIRAVFL